MKRPAKIALGAAASLALLALLASVAGIFVVRSQWFNDKVRARMVEELERATGGQAAIGSSRVDWDGLRVTVQDLVVRGTEPKEALPLLRISRIEVGFKVISLLARQVDLASLIVEDPAIHLIVRPDGSTNLPRPKVRRRDKTVVETILDLKVKRFRLDRGLFTLDDRKTPFSMKGENLKVEFAYDLARPRYLGNAAFDLDDAKFRNWKPVGARIQTSVEVEKNRIAFSRARIETAASRIEADATIENLSAPVLQARFSAQANVGEWAGILGIRELRGGSSQVSGEARFRGARDYQVTASVRAWGVDVRAGRVTVPDASLTTKLEAKPGLVRCEQVDARALGGRFSGQAVIGDGRSFEVSGEASEFAVERALAAAGIQAKTWSATASGPVRLSGILGVREVTLETRLAVTPAPGGAPLSGAVDLRLDTARRSLEFNNSVIETPSTHVTFTGRLHSEMRVNFKSANLDDLLPAINLVAAEPVKSLPVKLDGGEARFEGLVTGNLESPRIEGAASAANLVYDGRKIDRVSAPRVTVTRDGLHVEGGTLKQGAISLRAEGSVSLDAWKLTRQAAVEGAGSLEDAPLAELLRLAQIKDIPVAGVLSGTAKISGALDDPRLGAELTLAKATAYGERLDRVQAKVAYAARRIEVHDARITAGEGRARLKGLFEHPQGDFKNSKLRFEGSVANLRLETLEAVKKLGNGLAGVARAELRGEAALAGGAATLDSLDGQAFAEKLQLDGRALGMAALKMATRNGALTVALDSDFLGAGIHGEGEWKLEKGYPGKAAVVFSNITLARLRQWLGPGGDAKTPLDGLLSGRFDVEGPLTDPAAWKANLELPRLELKPGGGNAPLPEEIVFRNEGPLEFALDRSVLRVVNAKFAGGTTRLDIRGSVTFDRRNAWDLTVNGGLDLDSLRSLNRDWLTSGAVQVNAAVRGPLRRPTVQGRLDVKDASFSVIDLPNGLTSANGVVIFSGTRATIQEMSGEVGGGKVSATGFVEFEGAEPTFRLQLKANQVRVRYPEGVSTQANADLVVTGTQQQSLLAGDITVLRTGFAQRTDFSSILAKSSEPMLRPRARTGPLSGMQFDVRIETASDASFESNLAQAIQAEASLRLRGTPYNPILLGRVSITQGEIVFFGTKYTINQGTINFLNPVKLEPVLNLDLETKVRGIDVILTFSGPFNKLNVTHRADPPIEFSEVVALLATGRAPTSDPTLAARQSAADAGGYGQLGAAALVGQAIANPLSSRLQRFFGVSKLKIDPRLTGVENNPQARLTVEQQVTRELTFTYITDLARSNQQIVRVEWAASRQVSFVAVRDENGLFGIDILYKKAFR